jgi:hypothetical protein
LTPAAPRADDRGDVNASQEVRMDPDGSGRSDGGAHGLTRRTVLAGAGGLAGVAAVAPAAQAQAAQRLGVGGRGRAAAEVVGRVVQDGLAVTGHGFLTRLAGLPDDALFRGGDRSEAGARFTFTADTTVGDRFIRGALFSATLTGTIAFYLDAQGGDFDDPASFADGRRIATFDTRIQNVLTVIGPDQALTTLEAELTQRAAPVFQFGGRRARLGRRGLRTRMWASGPGSRMDAAAPRAVFEIAGRIDAAG